MTRRLAAVVVIALTACGGFAVYHAVSTHGANGANGAAAVRLTVGPDPATESDASVVAPGILTRPAGGPPPRAEKAGGENLRLLIANDSARAVAVTDLRVVQLTVAPPPSGTLFSRMVQPPAESGGLGVDLGSPRPEVRQMTAAGPLGPPFSAASQLWVPAHQQATVRLAVVVSLARSYSWKFQVRYDAGAGPRSATVRAPSVTGYVRSYQRVYDAEDGTWVPRLGTGYCATTGSSC